MEELLRRGQMLIQVEFRVLEIFIVAALYYLVMITAWGVVQRRLEAHFGRSVTPTAERKRPNGPSAANGSSTGLDRREMEHDLR
jgi:polar amino acid transport system permease protein